MLKIRDGVDLKELEKFGLKLKYECDADTGFTYITEIYKLVDDCQYCIRFVESPECYFLCYIDVDGSNILYDLIKADLVEKVED